MKNYYPALKKCPLFSGMTNKDIENTIKFSNVKHKAYAKGEFLLSAGERVKSIGIVICGSVSVIKEDFWGNRAIIAKMYPGDIFAESFAFADDCESTVSVIANEKAAALFIDFKSCIENGFEKNIQSVFVMNMLKIAANKNVRLTRKIEHIVKRSTREKLLSYLSEQAQSAQSCTFTIPFNRQELADYLSVDRSAMSTELGKLRNEGLIEFKKNRFTLFERRQIRF